jgi:hypothetical protein
LQRSSVLDRRGQGKSVATDQVWSLAQVRREVITDASSHMCMGFAVAAALTLQQRETDFNFERFSLSGSLIGFRRLICRLPTP